MNQFQPQPQTVCIVCKQPIEGIPQHTPHGPVHPGQCGAYYAEKSEQLSESTEIGDVIEETQLL